MQCLAHQDRLPLLGSVLVSITPSGAVHRRSAVSDAQPAAQTPPGISASRLKKLARQTKEANNTNSGVRTWPDPVSRDLGNGKASLSLFSRAGLPPRRRASGSRPSLP